jgi:protein ImuA
MGENGTKQEHIMLPESFPPGPAHFPAAQAAGSAKAAIPDDPAWRAEPGRLHELHAATPADAATAAAAALLLAAASAPRSPLLWLRPEAAERRGGKLYGPGLAELGLDPARLLLGVLPDDLAILKAGADALRAGSAGAVLLELHGAAGRLDLTASRRLALAAAATGTVALLLRVQAEARPSAAWRRWQVAAAPSRPLAARAPGAPAFAFELTRSRTGPAGAGGLFGWRAGRLVPPAPETPDETVPPLARLPLSLPPGRPAADAQCAA